MLYFMTYAIHFALSPQNTKNWRPTAIQSATVVPEYLAAHRQRGYDWGALQWDYRCTVAVPSRTLPPDLSSPCFNTHPQKFTKTHVDRNNNELHRTRQGATEVHASGFSKHIWSVARFTKNFLKFISLA